MSLSRYWDIASSYNFSAGQIGKDLSSSVSSSACSKLIIFCFNWLRRVVDYSIPSACADGCKCNCTKNWWVCDVMWMRNHSVRISSKPWSPSLAEFTWSWPWASLDHTSTYALIKSPINHWSTRSERVQIGWHYQLYRDRATMLVLIGHRFAHDFFLERNNLCRRLCAHGGGTPSLTQGEYRFGLKHVSER